MTYDITNYQILAEKDLCENDFLKFFLEDRTYTYVVAPRWLACMCSSIDTQILQDMKETGIINETPMEFCCRTYGYLRDIPFQDSIWPEIREGDFSSLTNCVFENFNLLHDYKKGKIFSKIELTELALDIW